MITQLLNRVLPVALSADLTPLKENGALLTDRVVTDGVIVMVVGFASVFLVLGIFYILIRLLNYLFPGDGKNGWKRISKKEREAMAKASATDSEADLFAN